MPIYLYNIETSIKVYADSQEEADDIVYIGSEQYPTWQDHPDVSIIDVDCMFVTVEDDEHDCSDADRPCDDCLTRNLPDHMDEP